MNFNRDIEQYVVKGMTSKLIILGILGLLLSGCSSFDYIVDKGQHLSKEAGKSLGLVKEREMRVPSYYSTDGLAKKPQAGQVFKLAE